jgi:glycosyltransferase involved in cell wall biosynthesis
MKVHILFDFKDISGGGNQFLKALRLHFSEIGIYSENINLADVIVYNSHHLPLKLLKLKIRHSKKIFVHRLDGPIKLYNKISDRRDDLIYLINKLISDGTIFQSYWSKEQNFKYGLSKKKFEDVILNAPNQNYFYPKKSSYLNSSNKIKLIAVSWSSNYKKGFSTYKWIDENLDFNKFEMKFVGNSPVSFKNIDVISVLDQEKLSNDLRASDIYLTASQKDPCSNSLIEALHCGLPVLALGDGGHPEIIQEAGELFKYPEEIPDLLLKIAENYQTYQSNINLPNMTNVGSLYVSFLKTIYNEQREGKFRSKKLKIVQILKVIIFIIFIKFTL